MVVAHHSFLLNFTYAEALEKKDPKDLVEIRATYDKFLGVLRTDLETLEASQKSSSSQGSDAANGSPPQATQGTQSQPNSQSTEGDEDRPKSPELLIRKSEYSLVWIMYMRFARRAENIKASRAVFTRARKDPWVTWEVYEAAGRSHLFPLAAFLI
jgi:cleavage stimulation factor subunit 3